MEESVATDIWKPLDFLRRKTFALILEMCFTQKSLNAITHLWLLDACNLCYNNLDKTFFFVLFFLQLQPVFIFCFIGELFAYPHCSTLVRYEYALTVCSVCGNSSVRSCFFYQYVTSCWSDVTVLPPICNEWGVISHGTVTYLWPWHSVSLCTKNV